MKSRAKGTRLERRVAEEFVRIDGLDDTIRAVASSAGRVGHLDLGADVITRRFACECKHIESLSDRLWIWLEHIRYPGKIRCLVIRRNQRSPLVVLEMSDFLALVDQRVPEKPAAAKLPTGDVPQGQLTVDDCLADGEQTTPS